MDWQYIPHRYLIDLEKEFECKRTALLYLKSIGLECPYISAGKSYDQLYIEELRKDFNTKEREYLKDGVLYIFECLKVIENEIKLSDEVKIKLILKKHKEYFEKYREMQNFGEEEEIAMISQMLYEQNIKENKIYTQSISALSRELAEFKMRLCRLDIFPIIENDHIEFIEGNITQTEFAIIETEEVTPNSANLHSDIFTDGYAFAFFEHLHSVFFVKGGKEIFADFSMIYRRMHSDRLILEGVRPTDYIKWIQKNYDISLGTSLKKAENALKIRFYEKLKALC